MDNGAAEDVVFGANHLMTLADEVGASEMVVPDTLFDYNDTIAKAQYFARHASPQFRYMAVLQGRKYDEFLTCFRAFSEMPIMSYITTIGVPRLMVTATGDPLARVKFMTIVQDNHLDASLEFHMLGGTSDLQEVKELKQFPSVRGIDTSAPIYMGILGHDIEEPYFSRPSSFDNLSRTDHMDTLTNNIDKYLMWADYKYEPPSS